jgi:hypothetical protein
MSSQTLNILLTLTDKASAEMKEFENKTKSISDNFKKMSMVGIAGFGAVSGVIIKASQDFAEFDENIQKAGANIGASEKQLDEFRKVAKKVGLETQFSAGQAADALFFLAGGSITAEQATAGLYEAVKIASTGELDLRDAVIAVGDAMTMFGVEAEEATKISDLFIYSTTRVQQTMPELSQAFKQVGSTARQAGLTIEETTGFLNLFADSGKRGMEGGIALANILRQLTVDVVPKYETTIKDLSGQKAKLSEQIKKEETNLKKLENTMRNASSKTMPNLTIRYNEITGKIKKYQAALNGTQSSITETTVKMSEKAKALHDLGIEIFDQNGNIKNMTGVISELTEKMRGMSDAQKMQTAETIFGSRSARDFLMILGAGEGAIQEYIEALNEAGGSANDFANRVDSARSPLEILRSTFEYISLTIGQVFLPAMRELALKIQPLVIQLAEWIEQNSTLVKWIAVIALGLFGLLAIIGIVGIAIISITKFVLAFKAAMILAVPVIKSMTIATALMGLKILAIIAVFALAVKWGWWLGKNWADVWGGIQIVVATVANVVMNIVEKMINFIVDGVNLIINQINNLLSKLASIPMIGKQFSNMKISTIERMSFDKFDTGLMYNNLVAGNRDLQNPVTINMTGNTFVGKEDIAEKIGDDIIKKLQLSNAI